MVSIRGTALSIIAALTMAMAAPAQGELEVGDRVLPAGGEVEIRYSNQDMAGDMVIVRVENGDGDETDVVLLQLNSNGYGEGSWSVPFGWDLAFLRAPEAPEVACLIGEGGN